MDSVQKVQHGSSSNQCQLAITRKGKISFYPISTIYLQKPYPEETTDVIGTYAKTASFSNYGSIHTNRTGTFSLIFAID